jgi:hypothetical protein
LESSERWFALALLVSAVACGNGSASNSGPTVSSGGSANPPAGGAGTAGAVVAMGGAPAGGGGAPSAVGGSAQSGASSAGAASVAGTNAGGAAGVGGGLAGAAGGAGTSAVVLGGPSLPCNFAFCENFEGYAEGTHPHDARWVNAVGGAQTIVDSLKPARGSRALHIKFEQNPQQSHWLRTNEPFPKLARQHFGRIFVWIEQLPDQKIEYRHWVTVQMEPLGNNPVLRVLGGETPPDIGANANNILKQNSAMFDLITPDEDRRREDTVNIVPKTWFCFEWSLDVDANQYRMWLDGKPMSGANWDHSNPAYTFAPIDHLWLGWTDWHNDSANWEVYLDEIALDSKRIGCDK